VTICNKL